MIKWILLLVVVVATVFLSSKFSPKWEIGGIVADDPVIQERGCQWDFCIASRGQPYNAYLFKFVDQDHVYDCTIAYCSSLKKGDMVKLTVQDNFFNLIPQAPLTVLKLKRY